LLNFVLEALQFLLRVQETLGNRVAEEGLALGVKSGDFTAIQRQSLLLALMKGASLLAQALVLFERARIRHE
jgi:hypothetical protein